MSKNKKDVFLDKNTQISFSDTPNISANIASRKNAFDFYSITKYLPDLIRFLENLEKI